MIRTPNAAFRKTALILCFLPALSVAAELRIAAASNFRPAMEPLVKEFETRSNHEVAVSYGSTGKHYAQLLNGAPFDVFLAADTERVRRLEASGVGVGGSRFTYAMGTLVLWSRDLELGEDGVAALKQLDWRFLSIANPRTAPYGVAAEQFLRRINLWEGLQSRIVRGENVSQAFAFVRSGNSDMGLVALSQAMQIQNDSTGWYWLVPKDYYEPIEQQAILLNENQAAVAFLAFLQGGQARGIISDHGYTVP